MTLLRQDLSDVTLPFADEHFDAVTMLAVFEHIAIDDLRLLLREVRLAAKPGGHYILTTSAGWTAGLLHFMSRVNLVSSEEIRLHARTHPRIAV